MTDNSDKVDGSSLSEKCRLCAAGQLSAQEEALSRGEETTPLCPQAKKWQRMLDTSSADMRPLPILGNQPRPGGNATGG